jgi:hypothetical protein
MGFGGSLNPSNLLGAMFPTSIGATLGLNKLQKMGGGGTNTTRNYVPPSQMDLFNAKVIAALAPIFFKQMAPGLSGQSTSEGMAQKTGMVKQGVGTASKMNLGPGTSQMYSMLDAMGKPGSAKKTADMMLLMYGKQPNIPATGGVSSQKTTPGLMDIAGTALNIGGLINKAQSPYDMQPQTTQMPRQDAVPFNIGGSQGEVAPFNTGVRYF